MDVQRVTPRVPPLELEGEVVKGFGRGSKQLGCPTANIPTEPYECLLEKEIPTGIYFGWASLRNTVYKMVMSIGWNPYYKNTKKTIEVHILHDFPEDFYGEHLKVVVTAYIRPEANFPSLDALKEAINNDIAIAQRELDLPEYVAYKTHKFLQK